MDKENEIVRERFLIYFWDDYKVSRIDSTCIPINHHQFLIEQPGMPAIEWLRAKQYIVRPYTAPSVHN